MRTGMSTVRVMSDSVFLLRKKGRHGAGPRDSVRPRHHLLVVGLCLGRRRHGKLHGGRPGGLSGKRPRQRRTGRTAGGSVAITGVSSAPTMDFPVYDVTIPANTTVDVQMRARDSVHATARDPWGAESNRGGSVLHGQQ